MNSVVEKTSKQIWNFPFFLLVAFLACEYARVHTFVGPIRVMRLPFIITIMLGIFVLKDGPNFRDLQTKCFLFLIVLMALHIPFATNNRWAFNTTYQMATYFIIHMAIVKYIDTNDKLNKFITLWLFFGIFLFLQGLFSKGNITSSAFFSDENDFALAMNIFFPIAYFKFMENTKKNLLFFAMAACFIFGSILSFSRGGFVGLAAVLFYIWIKSPKKIIGTVIAGVLVVFILSVAPPKYWEEISTISSEGTHGGTGAWRIYSWYTASKMFIDNPLVGVGPDNFRWRFGDYEPLELFRGRSHTGRVAHSVYFTLLPELGLIGVLLFFLIIFSNYKYIKKNLYLSFKGKKDFVHQKNIVESESIVNTNNFSNTASSSVTAISYGIYCGFVAYLVTGIFISVLYYPHFWILTSITTAMHKIKD